MVLNKDGSLSDTALGGTSELEPASDDVLLKAEPRDYFGSGMGKKSNSTSQLSATGEFFIIFYNIPLYICIFNMSSVFYSTVLCPIANLKIFYNKIKINK